MTNINYLQTCTITEFAEWLDKHGRFDDSPWMRWWDTEYCQKCDGIVVKCKDYADQEVTCAYCELENNCRFFKDLPDVPGTVSIIEMWLKRELEVTDLPTGGDELA